jgi:hypothetical protein
MKRIGLGALLLIGCAADHGKQQPPDVTQPRTCGATVTLDGHPASLGPMTLDATGISVCAHLDATQMTRAEFAASTDQRPGDASGFAATLEHVDYTTILDGWDVSVGEAPTQTFLNLEWPAPAGQTLDVIVWFRATGAPTKTQLALDLLDPLD